MLADDSKVTAALKEFGSVLSHVKGKPKAGDRAEILAGYFWVSVHDSDFESHISRAPESSLRLLATALGLNFDSLSKTPEWPSILVRRGHIWPNATHAPPKRKAFVGGSGQIQKPGDQIVVPDDAAADNEGISGGKRKRAGQGRRAAATQPDRSSGDDSSGRSSHGPSPPPAPPPTLASMPDALCDAAAFDALVNSICALPWLPTEQLRVGLPPLLWPVLWKGAGWSSRTSRDYDQMIKKQAAVGSFYSRQEDRSSPGAIFRLSLIYEGDDGLLPASKILCWLVNAERYSDFIGPGRSQHGGAAKRNAFISHRADLASSWNAVLGDIRHGHAVSSVSSCNFTENLLEVLERRYARFHDLISAGPVREELLANCARQYREARSFLAAFHADISARASSMAHEIQARFVGNHFLTLFKPSMDFLLDSASGLIPGGISPEGLADDTSDENPPACGGGKSVTPKAKPTPPTAVATPRTPASAAMGLMPPAYEPHPHYGPAASWPPFAQAQYPFYGVHHSSPPGPPYMAYAPPTPPRTTGGGGGGGVTFANPPVTSPSGSGGVEVKSEFDSPKFLAQPQHAWVTGEDSKVVTGKKAWKPVCGCANHSQTGASKHATWDCPLRYWKMCGRCPGFFENGTRDPSQWDGDNLTKAAKAAWRDLIKEHVLPLPWDANARPTPF